MIGRTVGHYRILERLGGGGMGVVYKAEDLTLGRFVALKFLPPELTRDPEAKSRFLREARAASLLDHTNICTIHEIGETGDEQTFIAMACYDGETLATTIERGAMGVDDALQLGVQIARGLRKAHDSGIVHRDIKPANVIVTAEGIAKILDFGLAKLAGATHITQSKTTMGTLAYMAPEQLRGETVGPQADLWALGVVLFELLTGQRPFRGDYAQAVAYSILNEQPASLTELKPEALPELERIIRKLLRKDPLQRYQTAEEVLAELETLRAPSSGSGKSSPRAARPRESLRAGARLGPYEIAEPLGSGGMGDVYRARDTRLDRQVAIKVLAPEFSEDAERRQRFQREAKTISSLSHPNICTLFDVGEQEGTDYLVMEYLEGETLADRLTKGVLALSVLLKIGVQIGEALGAAHRQGVIHRDLKPGNVMLTTTGAVKLVDFGLAKDIGAVTSMPRHASTPDKPLTAEGALVGTLAYMAPEQVEGREADARSDIFAFGAILYEMATGKRAFEGASKASLIVAILEKEPPLLGDTRGVSESSERGIRSLATIEHAVRQCLEKDPEKRWQSALDVANELRWLAAKGAEPGDVTTVTRLRSRFQRWLVAAAVTALVLASAGLGVWGGRSFLQPKGAPESARGDGTNLRVSIDLRGAPPLAQGKYAPLVGYVSTLLALSHDGSVLVYVGAADGKSRLFRRRIDRFEVEPIDGTEGAHFACFSPDDRWIALLVGDQVKKVPATGGAPITLANVATPSRAVWTANGIAVIGRTGSDLSLVPVDSGPAKLLVSSRQYSFSDVHPNGKFALGYDMFEAGSMNYVQTMLFDIEKGSWTPLLTRGYAAQFVPPRHVAYVSDSNLHLIDVDLEARRVVGEPVILQSGVANDSNFAQAQYAIAESGLLAFVPGNDNCVGLLHWIDRNGAIEIVNALPALYGLFALSPDGRRLVTEVYDVEDSIRVLDLERGELRKLAIGGFPFGPEWVRGDRIVFNWRPQPGDPWRVVSVNDVGQDLKTVRSEGGGGILMLAVSWDGGTMIAGPPDEKALRLSSDRLTADRSLEGGCPSIRGDGDWFAWMSERTGRFEVWVAPLSNPSRERQVSAGGGVEPLFCRACPMMFYREGSRFYGVKLPVGESSEWGAPELLWEADFIDTQGRSYDVSPDGKRLLVSRPAVPAVTDRIQLIQDWRALLATGVDATSP